MYLQLYIVTLFDRSARQHTGACREGLGLLVGIHTHCCNIYRLHYDIYLTSFQNPLRYSAFLKPRILPDRTCM